MEYLNQQDTHTPLCRAQNKHRKYKVLTGELWQPLLLLADTKLLSRIKFKGNKYRERNMENVATLNAACFLAITNCIICSDSKQAVSKVRIKG